MQKIMKNKGITLIALVITIIILLILAGTTLNMALSSNGIFNMAKKVTESYKIASEREYLEENVLSVQLDKYIGNVSSEKLGKELNKRNLSSNWHIIKVNDVSYETGWNYIGKGTELKGYGKAENSWLVNYETGEIIELEEGKYSSITVEDTIAIRDSLIINIDSAMIDNNVQNTKESIEATLGEGVELHNFDFLNDGLINNEFVFDGENDFITIDYNEFKEEQKNNIGEWFENGFTFEFYGKVKSGTHYAYSKDKRGTKINKDFKGYSNNFGIFQITQENDDNTDRLSRVIAFGNGYTDAGKNLKEFFLAFNNQGNDLYDEFSASQDSNWWKVYRITKIDDNVHYYTISIMKNDDGSFSQTYYEDGKIIKAGTLNKNCITEMSSLKKGLMTIGAIQQGYVGGDQTFYNQASTSKIEAKCLRIHNRGLTTEEVFQNYKKTTEYHNLMENIN